MDVIIYTMAYFALGGSTIGLILATSPPDEAGHAIKALWGIVFLWPVVLPAYVIMRTAHFWRKA
jgi:hypothetical protein